MNNKPDTVITEKGSKNVHVLTSGGKSESITVIACCNAAGQFLSLLLIFKDVNKKHEFGDGPPPRFRRAQEREIVINWHGFMHQAVHRTFPQT